MSNKNKLLLENDIIFDYDYDNSIKYKFSESFDLILYQYYNVNIVFGNKNEIITSEILINKNEKYILCSRYNFIDLNLDSVIQYKNNSSSSNSDSIKKSIKYGNYLLINSINYNYYHFIVDTIIVTFFYLNFLWKKDINIILLVPTEYYRNYINNSNIFKNFLNIDNISIEIIDNKYSYEHLYFGTNVVEICDEKNVGYQNFISKIFNSLTPNTNLTMKNKYLYISKKNNNLKNTLINNENHRLIVNEDILIDFLKSINFDIVELSSKSIQEKCNIMNSYDIIILHTGASALNSFFNKSRGKILILDDEFIHFEGRNILFKKNNIIIIKNYIKLHGEKSDIDIGQRKIINFEKLKLEIQKNL